MSRSVVVQVEVQTVLKHVAKRGAASRRCLILCAHQSAGEALLAAVRASNVEEVRRFTVHRDPTLLEYRDPATVQSHPITSYHNILNLIDSNSIKKSVD
jgi:hypothetical protein